MTILAGMVISFVIGFLMGMLVMALAGISGDCDDAQGTR